MNDSLIIFIVRFILFAINTAVVVWFSFKIIEKKRDDKKYHTLVIFLMLFILAIVYQIIDFYTA